MTSSDAPSELGTSSYSGAQDRTDPARVGVRIWLKLVLILVSWVLIVAGSLGWNLRQADRHRENLALETARSFFDLLVLTRHWNAQHGGVYAPITQDTQPNPYLKDPRREIPVTDDLTLTKINPAFMTRQLAELAAEGKGVQFRITSLKPIRPANHALPWEAEALRAFEDGAEEWGQLFKAGDQWGYRYMAPLITERPCLKCHEDQGYALGDVRGGISVVLPALLPVPVAALVGSHLSIALAGILVILVMGRLLARAYDRLRRQAVFDALTSIPNRRFFIEQLVHELRRGRRERMPLSLLICDIDYFKGYNDTFGHQAGDRCLCAVAELLRDSLHRGSDFCARYGGEEFVVVLPNTDLAGAVRIGEQIREAIAGLGIRHPASPHGVVTISIGVADDVAGEHDHEELIHRADEALYRAKELGRDRVEVHGSGLAAAVRNGPHSQRPDGAGSDAKPDGDSFALPGGR
ncbi:diguanylate cyclase [Thiocystis violacea]|uniref:diguanylate cyclase n=1 Tax=Thiocystis violacea TaxID=13725 RepID=UPI0019039056|nr:diguanylate cyclase [Thiocystis violacea]MBK1718280.1 hypothetical protein [Thiocystis violacea]